MQEYEELVAIAGPWLTIGEPVRINRTLKRLPGDFPVEVRLYPQARHAFDVPELPPLLPWRGGGMLGHDPNAAAAAWEEVKRFLGR